MICISKKLFEIVNVTKKLPFLIKVLCCFVLLIASQNTIAGYPNSFSESQDDIYVKVMGGYVTVKRTFYEGQWHFNRNWSPLTIQYDALTNEPSEIRRFDAVYKMADSSGKIFKNTPRKTIHRLSNGYLWVNLEGNWIEYDNNGRILGYGDKNNVKVTFSFDSEGRISGVFDHFGTQVFWYTHDAAGNLTQVKDTTDRQVSYEYNASNQLEAVIDVRGNRWEYDYGAAGGVPVITAMTDPLDRTITYTYNAAGMLKTKRYADNTGMSYGYRYGVTAATKGQAIVTALSTSGKEEITYYDSITGRAVRKEIGGVTIYTRAFSSSEIATTDKNGNTTVRTRDGLYNTTKITYPDNSTKKYKYTTISVSLGLAASPEVKSSLSLLKEFTDENGNKTTYAYDTRGNHISVVTSKGTNIESTIAFVNDSFGNIIKKTEASGTNDAAVWATIYNEYGSQIKITDPESGEIQFIYDVMGNRTVLVDAQGNEWVSTYDSAGNQTSKVNPLGNSYSYKYDAAGNKIKITDPINNAWVYVFDARDNVISVSDSMGYTRTYKYNDDNQRIEIEDEEGHKIYRKFDAINRLVSVSDDSGYGVERRYANFNTPGGGGSEQPTSFVHPTFEQELVYDSRNRLIKVADIADGKERREIFYHRDLVGNILSMVDPNGYATHFNYDSKNRITSEISPSSSARKYSYDWRGNRVGIEDPNNNTYTLDYNKMGRLIREKNPLGQSFSWQYNKAGSLVSYQDPKGQYVELSYDNSYRILREEYYASAGDVDPIEVVNYKYDPRGLLVSWDDGVNSGRFEYDSQGRRTLESVNYGAVTFELSYTYYKNGLLRSSVAPNGLVTKFIYDSSNLLQTVDIAGYGNVTVSKRVNRLRSEIKYPGNFLSKREYDNFERLKNIEVLDVSGSRVFQRIYDYLPDNQLYKESGDVEIVYEYDRDKKLISESRGGALKLNYMYDKSGNRIGVANNTQSWVYNENSQLVRNDENEYEYDLNGSLVRSESSSEIITYTYDHRNRLIKVDSSVIGEVGKYKYDPFGRRIQKQVDGEITYFVYSKRGLIAEIDEAGNYKKIYQYWPGSPWGTDPLFKYTPEGINFYISNNIGAPIAQLDSSGEISSLSMRDAFGGASESDVDNNLVFPGQYHDIETGLNYNFHRYYSSDLGRYIQSDPVRYFGASNLYAYSDNNPINSFDPLGLKPRSTHSSRNSLNKCPLCEPGENEDGEYVDSAGEQWNKRPEWKTKYHPGKNVYERPDPDLPGSGFECSYDKDTGYLDPYDGTYNYVAPDGIISGIVHWNPAGWWDVSDVYEHDNDVPAKDQYIPTDFIYTNDSDVDMYDAEDLGR
ncbi:RHS repeat-associated core domain-containing protein [Halioxenophilus aromaticivorans]|uniref:Teneurin-like YD-shell domain-containing protein n=1 Tax=Halioxenophilus aromaticivorans TaxID=1306992 RepID=A0AAV3TZL7_9ALTE